MVVLAHAQKASHMPQELCLFTFLAATKQLYEWFRPSDGQSVCPSVCPSHFFTMFPSYYHEIFKSYYHWPKCVKLQNLFRYKTGFVSRQILHFLWKLQNWICPKTGQYKTCKVSNTKTEASMRAIKSKPWQSHLTSETVEIFNQNEKAG